MAFYEAAFRCPASRMGMLKSPPEVNKVRQSSGLCWDVTLHSRPLAVLPEYLNLNAFLNEVSLKPTLNPKSFSPQP